MMATTSVGEVKRLLTTFGRENNVALAAVVSRAGMPIAWTVPEEVHLDNFATLAATLIGAGEVIYTGLGKSPPRRVAVESEEGVLVAAGLGPRLFFVALLPSRAEALLEAMDAATATLRELLKE